MVKSQSLTENLLKNLFSLQKAEAQLAYELQAAKIQQKIRNEEIQIQVVERRKQIEIEEQEIRRKEKELMSTVKLPAEAEAYKVQTIAEGKRYVRPCNITQCENYGNLLSHAFVKKFREINAFTKGATKVDLTEHFSVRVIFCTVSGIFT